MERENHNPTMERNEISFLRLTAMSRPSNFNLVFIEIHISSEQQKGWALCKMSIVKRVASVPADVILVVADTCTRRDKHTTSYGCVCRCVLTGCSELFMRSQRML